jgi:hypothetical protein
MFQYDHNKAVDRNAVSSLTHVQILYFPHYFAVVRIERVTSIASTYLALKSLCV